MGTKTDNANMPAKLELRRYFLEKYHADGQADVLDCCQGSGHIWRELRKTHEVRTYWGLDLKPKKGRLKIDSVRVLQQPGWTQNVIDVDTYGSPWKHWAALLPNVVRPVTVFLTIGQTMMGIDRYVYESLGLGDIPVPPGIGRQLVQFSLQYCLAQSHLHHTILREVAEASSGPHARYLGVRLEPLRMSMEESHVRTNADRLD